MKTIAYLILICASMIFGWGIGKVGADNYWQKEVVKRGCAYYATTNTTHVVSQFTWNTNR